MFGRMRKAIKELKDEIDWSREFNAREDSIELIPEPDDTKKEGT